MEQNKMHPPDWELLATRIAVRLKELEKPEKRFLKSGEIRAMLGGISAAKLQSLRIGGHLPAVNADGLWLYEYEDVLNFTKKNKIVGEAATGR